MKRVNNSFNQKKGIALITVLVFMLILMIVAVYLTIQMTTHIRFTSSLKKVEALFSLADGACARAINYLKNNAPLPNKWNLKDTLLIDKNLPEYLNGTENLFNTVHFKGKIYYHGYDSSPLPGWMLNWSGYSGYYQIYYEALGNASDSDSKAEVSALIIRIRR